MFTIETTILSRIGPRLLLVCLVTLCLFLRLDSFAHAQEPASDTPAQGDAVLSNGASGRPADAANKVKPGFFPQVWQMLTDEANVTAGVGVLQLSLKIKRHLDGAEATMVQQDRSTLFLSYSTRPSFFTNSNFGYTVMIGYTDFDMTQQKTVYGWLAYLGTEVTGNMIYAVPTLYYQWGEHRYNGTFVRLGVGVGAGAATYTGTVQLSSGEKISTSNRSYTPRLTLTDFLEARWHHIGVSISYAAPRIQGDDYDIKVANWSASIGYTYYF
jgi:hypothetical protein